MLTLAEELFLLSLHDKRSAARFSRLNALPYALAGAVLIELFLMGKLGLDKSRVILLDDGPCEDKLLNETLARIQASERPAKLTRWIETLGQKGKKLRNRLALSMVDKGILRAEEKHFMWVIPYTAYPEQDASAKYWIKHRLRLIVLAGEPADARAVIMLHLAATCGLSNHLFTQDEIKAASKRVETLIRDEAVGEGVSETIRAIGDATIASVTAV